MTKLKFLIIMAVLMSTALVGMTIVLTIYKDFDYIVTFVLSILFYIYVIYNARRDWE